ncbi:Transposable element Hobo transposase [Frankliniella fusca]|uniref:Transposable element Hobo transposase n=1 Tax=Frankliniella fusca TaxID=407009 RepID=A0AAE1HEU5_9NEOP|nr:Transposable element Hobo transposase [Frankliniella fusca]
MAGADSEQEDDVDVPPEQTPTLTPDEVNEKLAAGDFWLVEVKSSSSARKSSPMWLVYQKVCIKNTEKAVGFVKCLKCQEVRQHTHKTGTTAACKHKCVREAKEARERAEQLGLAEAAGDNPRRRRSALLPLVDPPQDLKKDVLRSSVVYCATDLAAFSSVEGEGFLALAQKLVDVGVDAGRVNVRRLLPDRTTVSKNLDQLADEAKVVFVPRMQKHIETRTCAATTDMWTQENKKHHFLALKVHMSDDSPEPKPEVRTAFTVPFEEDSATGDNIWHSIVAQFALLGVTEEEVQKIVFVTDRGANIVSALKGRAVRLNCTAHIFNSILQTALVIKKYSLNVLDEEASQVVQDVKSALVSANLNLPGGVKQFAITQQVQNRLQASSEGFLLEGIDRDKVTDLANILKALDGPLRRHQCVDISGTLWPEFQKVTSPSDEDSPMVSRLKASWRDQLIPLEYDFVRQQCKALVSHVKRSSIEPRLKNALRQEMEVRWNSTLKMFESIAKVHGEVYAQIRANHLRDDNAGPPPTKRPKVAECMQKYLEDDEEALALEDELDRYLKEPIIDDSDLMNWWQQRRDRFPCLAALDEQLLCIPATSASSEREFSEAGHIFRQKRLSLLPETASNILFLHSNADLLNLQLPRPPQDPPAPDPNNQPL